MKLSKKNIVMQNQDIDQENKNKLIQKRVNKAIFEQELNFFIKTKDLNDFIKGIEVDIQNENEYPIIGVSNLYRSKLRLSVISFTLISSIRDILSRLSSDYDKTKFIVDVAKNQADEEFRVNKNKIQFLNGLSELYYKTLVDLTLNYMKSKIDYDKFNDENINQIQINLNIKDIFNEAFCNELYDNNLNIKKIYKKKIEESKLKKALKAEVKKLFEVEYADEIKFGNFHKK